jgi:hypothetical protein
VYDQHFRVGKGVHRRWLTRIRSIHPEQFGKVSRDRDARRGGTIFQLISSGRRGKRAVDGERLSWKARGASINFVFLAIPLRGRPVGIAGENRQGTELDQLRGIRSQVERKHPSSYAYEYVADLVVIVADRLDSFFKILCRNLSLPLFVSCPAPFNLYPKWSYVREIHRSY